MKEQNSGTDLPQSNSVLIKIKSKIILYSYPFGKNNKKPGK